MRERLRALGKNLLLVILGCGVGFGGLELGARMILLSRPPGKSGEQAAYTIFDPVLGWRNKPGAAVTYNRREYKTTVEINSLGFRDVERSVAKPKDRPRILVLGDSFVEAYSVERDQSLTRRLEGLAEEAGCPADVVNAGVHGYSTDQEALWYAREGEPLGADIVAIAVYYNDIIHTVRSRYSGSPKPLVEVQDGVLTPINTPLPRSAPRTGPAIGTVRRDIEGSALKTLILDRLFTGAPRLHQRLAGIGLLEPYEAETVPAELRVYKTRGQLPEIEAAWSRTEAILGSLGATIRARGAAPALVHIPALFEVSARAFDLTVLRYGLTREAWAESRVRTRLGEIAASTGFAFLDLSPALRASVSLIAGEPYFPYDGHWNAMGHEVAARALLSFLHDRALLSCKRLPT
ncbi:MAG: SGNH/GDSL hydrolase family protein [Vicinamibacteria bacterium]|nr:SGNH/GDSL hydrolase family protein [Vicinamibacteria bacterium]